MPSAMAWCITNSPRRLSGSPVRNHICHNGRTRSRRRRRNCSTVRLKLSHHRLAPGSGSAATCSPRSGSQHPPTAAHPAVAAVHKELPEPGTRCSRPATASPDSLDPEPAVCVEQAAAVEHRKGADVLGPDLIQPQHDPWSSRSAVPSAPSLATSIGQWRGPGPGTFDPRVRAMASSFPIQFGATSAPGATSASVAIMSRRGAVLASRMIGGMPSRQLEMKARIARSSTAGRRSVWLAASATDASSSPTATSLPTSFRLHFLVRNRH